LPPDLRPALDKGADTSQNDVGADRKLRRPRL
jgi:hypothetical protein